MVKQKLYDYLVLLHGIIAISPYYTTVSEHIKQIKDISGTSFVYTEEQWHTILLTIETLEIPLQYVSKDSLHIKEVPYVNMYNELNKISLDFFMLSNCSYNERKELVEYFVLANAYMLTYKIGINEWINSSEGSNTIKTACSALIERPWALILLLIELMPKDITIILPNLE